MSIESKLQQYEATEQERNTLLAERAAIMAQIQDQLALVDSKLDKQAEEAQKEAEELAKSFTHEELSTAAGFRAFSKITWHSGRGTHRDRTLYKDTYVTHVAYQDLDEGILATFDVSINDDDAPKLERTVHFLEPILKAMSEISDYAHVNVFNDHSCFDSPVRYNAKNGNYVVENIREFPTLKEALTYANR